MPTSDGEAMLAIGRLGAPKGVRGDLKVQSYSGEFEHFLGLKSALLRGADPATGAPRLLKLAISRVERSGGGLSMAFAGYDSPEAARALTGMEMLASRENCAPLRKDEWYVTDLVGLSLVSGGAPVATVRAVLEGGPDPWLESVIPGAGRTALVPFRKEFVGEVDLKAGTIELLAPWLLDE
jgi:16S rRNA processing protein RimM